MKGGYQIIDFKGKELGEDAITITGAYAKALTGKAILCENVVIGSGLPPISFFATATPSDYGYVLSTIMFGTYSYAITITDEDGVTAIVTELATAGE